MTDLTSQPKPVQKMDLTAATLPTVVSDKQVVDARVARYQFALGEDAPPQEELTKTVAKGDETNLRVAASTKDYLKKIEFSQNMLPDAIRSVSGDQVGDPEYIQALLQQAATAPDIVLESKFAQNTVNTLQSMSDDPAQAAEEVQDPSGAEILYKATEDVITKKQVAVKLAEDWGNKTKSMSWGPYLGYTAVQMAPVLQWANFASYDSKKNAPNLTGENKFKKIQQLYSLPPEQFKIEAEKEINRLAETNPLDAQEFADNLVSYGDSDRQIDNALTVFNVATGVTAGVVTKSLIKLSKTANRMRKIARAVNQPVTTIPDVLANAGHIVDSAEAASTELLAKKFAPKNAPDAVVENFKSFIQRAPSIYNPKFFLKGEGNMSPQLTERLLSISENNISKLAEAGHIIRPGTLTREALDKAQELSLQEYKKLFPKLSDNIMRVQNVLPEDTGTNTGKMIIHWGKDEGRSTFQTESGAIHTAKLRYKLKDFKPVQISEDSWVIETTADVSENFEDVYKLLKTTNSSGPTSLWTYLRSVAGAKEKVSDFHAQQRAATVHGTTEMGEIVASVWRPALEKLSNKELADLDVVMAVNRDSYRVPGDPDTRGMFYENYSELNQAYLQIHKRPVRDNEAAAYMTARQMSDFDWMVRSENAARSKIRVGVQNHTFSLPVQGKKTSITIEAAKIDKLPINSKDDANVLIYGEGDSVVSVSRLSDLANDPDLKHGGQVSLINNLFERGYTALQVYDPSRRDINDLLNYAEPIHYIAVKGTRPSAIRLDNQVPYRPGFHVEYNQPWYIKQAKFGFNKGRRAHLGDTTLLGIRTEKEGRTFLNTLAEAQRLYKAKYSGLKDFLEKNTPWSPEEFVKIMKNFDDSTPFVLARDGKTSADGSSLTSSGQTMGEVYGQFDNLINSPHNPALLHNFEFMGEKDPMLNKLVVQGTQRDPVYKLEDADLLSPLATQTRAMGRLIRSVGYEDYQIGSVMSYLAEFGSALKFNGNPVSPEMLRRNPLFYFKHTEIDHGDAMFKEQARQIKQVINDLVGQPSQYAIGLEDYVQKLSENIRIPFSEKTLPFLKDPLRYARAAVSHMKLGLFNPVQLFLQQATHMNILAISPLHGGAQIPATILMRFADKSEDPKIWEHFASLVEKSYGTEAKGKYSWTPAKFKESLEGYRRSGFGKIGGEYAWRNDISDPKLFRGKVGKFLDKGYVFFNHAEQNVRMASWNTAYSEYLANSGKTAGSLKDADFRKILVRAQDLSGNMSRDASAFWQKGVLGSTTQYYAYTARILELLVGKRLTLAEKARLGGGLSLLYGFPVLAGATYLAQTGDVQGALTAVNPFDEDLRTYALENGLPIDDTAWGVINNGLASSALYLMTGQHFDVASRYSPLNLDAVGNIKRNFEQNDPTAAILISAMGASGSIIRDVMESSYPLAKDLYQMVGEGETSSLVMEDIFNMTRELSSVNAAYKAYTAWNGLQYLSKKGTLISADNGEEANLKILEALTGLQSYGETDVFRKINSMKLESKGQEEVKKELRKYGTYYIQALRDNDRTGMDQFMRRIEALMLNIHDEKDKSRLLVDIFDQPELRDAVSQSFSKKGSEEQQIRRQMQETSQ